MPGSEEQTPHRRDVLKLGTGAAAWAAVQKAGGAAAQVSRHLGVVDGHAHWQPEPYLAAMKELGRPLKSDPVNFDLPRRLKRMDEQGVQMQVLSILTPAIQWASPQDGARLSRLVNDAGIEAYTAYPDRFRVGVAMPVQDPALALAELNRVAGKPGICAVHLPTWNDGQDFLFKPEFAPVFARAEELGYPLVFHPIGKVSGQERLDGHDAFLFNTVGFPFEHTITAARMIVEGVLDRHPSLDIVLYHAGGAFPYVAGRIEYGLMKKKITLPQPFDYYIRRFHYDTIAYDPKTLRFLIDRVGADRVVIGTDNYAFMDVDRPTALVESLSLPPEDHERILTSNAARLFRL